LQLRETRIHAALRRDAPLFMRGRGSAACPVHVLFTGFVVEIARAMCAEQLRSML
jgi:hypothetical protein